MGATRRDIDDAENYTKLSDILHGVVREPEKKISKPREIKPYVSTPEYRERIREYRRKRRADGKEPMNYR